MSELPGELGHAGTDVAIESFDDVGNLLAVHGFVVGISGGPDGGAGLGIVELKLEGKAA